MKTTLLLLAFCLSIPLYSQRYTPVDTLANATKQAELLAYFNSKTKSLELEFKSYPKSDKKSIKKFVSDRKEIFEELTKDNQLLFDTELETYINTLLQNIAANNGIDSKDLKIFLSRDTSPNAYSLGDGNFVFTISLLNRLENEDELYFIIAHELSHYYLDHLKKRIAEIMQMTKSEEYVSKQKIVKKSKYNKFSKSVEQYRDLQYGSSSLRRQRELEADSLGFIFSKKVIKDPQNAISALQKLDSISPAEILKINMDVLVKHFATPTMSFKEEWTNGHDFTKYNYQRGKVDMFGTHKDSLKSHPEFAERISSLQTMMPNNQKQVEAKTDNFIKLKEKIRFEDVYAHYCLEEYGRGIYLVLQLQNLEQVSENEELFYQYMLGLFYEKLTDARKTYKFKKFVDEHNVKDFSTEYSLFLTILDNLRTSELKELSNKYKIN